MEIEVIIWLMRDSFDNKEFLITEETDDRENVTLKNKKGVDVYFSNKVYRLPKFCEENNIDLKIIKIKNHFDSLWDKEKDEDFIFASLNHVWKIKYQQFQEGEMQEDSLKRRLKGEGFVDAVKIITELYRPINPKDLQ